MTEQRFKHKFLCGFDDATMEFVNSEADALGISKASYIRMSVREKMTGRSRVRGYSAPAEPQQHVFEEVDALVPDDEGELVDDDAIFARAVNEAERDGAFTQREDGRFDEPIRDGEVRRVVGRRPGLGGNPHLDAGRFSLRGR